MVVRGELTRFYDQPENAVSGLHGEVWHFQDVDEFRIDGWS
jgi:hypothetical protein